MALGGRGGPEWTMSPSEETKPEPAASQDVGFARNETGSTMTPMPDAGQPGSRSHGSEPTVFHDEFTWPFHDMDALPLPPHDWGQDVKMEEADPHPPNPAPHSTATTTQPPAPAAPATSDHLSPAPAPARLSAALPPLAPPAPVGSCGVAPAPAPAGTAAPQLQAMDAGRGAEPALCIAAGHKADSWAAPRPAAPGAAPTTASGSLAARRGERMPDFAMIYAFVGSLFDVDCARVDHHNILGQMPELERNTTTIVMQNLVANLTCTPALSEHLQLLVEHTASSRRQAGPATLSATASCTITPGDSLIIKA